MRVMLNSFINNIQALLLVENPSTAACEGKRKRKGIDTEKDIKTNVSKL